MGNSWQDGDRNAQMVPSDLASQFGSDDMHIGLVFQLWLQVESLQKDPSSLQNAIQHLKEWYEPVSISVECSRGKFNVYRIEP